MTRFQEDQELIASLRAALAAERAKQAERMETCPYYQSDPACRCVACRLRAVEQEREQLEIALKSEAFLAESLASEREAHARTRDLVGQLQAQQADIADAVWAKAKAQRCGNCRDGVEMGFVGGNRWACDSERSACAIVGRRWPADHGCPQWKAKA